MNRILCSFLISIALCHSALAAEADELLGLWQNDDRPVFVQIGDSPQGINGIIQSNSERPESVGKHSFSNLVFDADKQVWRGQVYVLRLDKNKDVSVELLSPTQFKITVKIGFLSRSVTWSRVGRN
jgi:uncharacterized protein (DUF2147 family)